MCNNEMWPLEPYILVTMKNLFRGVVHILDSQQNDDDYNKNNINNDSASSNDSGSEL